MMHEDLSALTFVTFTMQKTISQLVNQILITFLVKIYLLLLRKHAQTAPNIFHGCPIAAMINLHKVTFGVRTKSINTLINAHGFYWSLHLSS